MTNLNGHPLHTITFRAGRRTLTNQVFAADATAARTYFDRVIVRDWTGATPPTFVAADLA